PPSPSLHDALPISLRRLVQGIELALRGDLLGQCGQFGSVDHLPARLVLGRRQAPLLDPPADRVGGDTEEVSGGADAELCPARTLATTVAAPRQESNLRHPLRGAGAPGAA